MKINNGINNNQFESSDVYRKFCNILPNVCKLIQQENYNKSLKLVDDFYSKNACCDQSDQLRYECDKWIALILEKDRCYDESLKILRKLYKNVKPDDEMFISYQTNIVRILIKMRRFEDAILESKITLDKQVNEDVIDLLTFFFYYVQALQASSNQLPAQYFNLTKEIINELDPKLLNLISLNSENLFKAILEIYEKHNTANKRYSQLVVSLNATDDNLYKVGLLKSYIKNESFAFYKKMALEELHELENNFS